MGTSEKEAAGLHGPSIGLIYGQAQGMGSGYAVEGRLNNRAAHGGIIGSYDPETMERLLRYHAMEDVAPAVGSMMLGGERFDA